MHRRSSLLIAFILICACGGTTAPIATVSPTPSQDPLSVARLEGVYDVTYIVTAMSGATTDTRMGEKTLRVWTATPKCASGPCDTDIKSVSPPSKAITTSVLSFAAGSYHLSQSVIGVDCGKTTKFNAFDNAITISVTPSRFITVGTTVFVAELTGTRSQIGTPRAIAIRLGCKKGFTYAFSALIVRRG
jgi:hypothetical protein